jgi:hypothetical protein
MGPPLPDQYYHGAIDEVRVWLRALSEDEIVSSMEMDSSDLVGGAGAVDPSGKLASIWGSMKLGL